MDSKKSYFIPRKVTDGFRLFGLNWKELLILIAVIVGFIVFAIVFSLPTKAKIVIGVFTIGVTFMGMTVVLGNGLRIKEYAKLLFKYWVLDQNDYSLISSKTPSQQHKQILYLKPLREARPIIIADEIPITEVKTQEERDQELEELRQWIPVPKSLDNLED